MVKLNYTSEEFQKIIEDLFQEKKKGEKLQQQLEQIRAGKNSNEDEDPENRESLFIQIQKLKELTISYKEKYEKLLTSKENHADSSKLSEANQKIILLLNKASELSEKIGSLEQQLDLAKQNEKILYLERQKKDQELASVLSQLESFQNQIRLNQTKQEQLVLELNDKEQVLRFIQESEASYKNKSLQKEKELEEILKLNSQQIKKLQEEKDKLEVMFGEIKLHADQLEKGMHYLRSKSEESREEARQLGIELALSQDKIKSLEVELNTSKDFSQSHVKDNEILIETISEKDSLITSLRQEICQLYEATGSFRSQVDEKENQFKIAQQHLAKKVKENTLLNEKFENLKIQITELQNDLSIGQSRMQDLKNMSETHQLQEKRLQDILNDTIKSAEEQNHRWEEKYFKLYDKWVEAEAQNKELKNLEEKHNQMQVLLSSLEHILNEKSGVRSQSSTSE